MLCFYGSCFLYYGFYNNKLSQSFTRIYVENSPNVNQSFIFDRKDKVKHYIGIKTYKTIVLRF